MAVENFGTSSVLLWLTILLFCVLLFHNKIAKGRDPREPPDVPSFIPWIGHIVGLYRYRNHYYSILRARCRWPIYSIPVGGSRMYVANSADIVRAAERQPKLLSFWFVEATATSRISGLSKEASRKILENVKEGTGVESLLIEGLDETHKAMRPGSGVNQMVSITTQTAADNMRIFEIDPASRRIDLWEWVQHEITIATTEAVYGPTNPYRDKDFEQAFWDFTEDTMMLMPGFLPGLLAPKGYAGREKVVATFQRYFAANGAETGSVLTKARHKVLKRYFSAEDTARYECVNGLAILLNSVPTAFWTIYHIFSDQELLKTVRHHVENITTVKEDGGKRLRVIDLARLEEIPILASVVQESLRFRTTGVGPRMVMEDIMLSNRYLIKKGRYFMIPGHEMHFDQQIWGDTTSTFDAQRFNKTGTKRVPSAAFRGFGGGVNLCPGKGFAMAEIIAFVALLAARFDLRPESGHWIEPGQDLSNISLSIAPPKKRIIVDVLPRKEVEGVLWSI